MRERGAVAVEARGRLDEVKARGGGEVGCREDLGVGELAGFEDEFEDDGVWAKGAYGCEFSIYNGVIWDFVVFAVRTGVFGGVGGRDAVDGAVLGADDVLGGCGLVVLG